MTVRAEAGRRACLFGPFRSPLEAGRAREALHKVFALRPCDYVFEPDPALALGLGCIYAQIRTCSAPCLVRIGEDEYRGLAREAAAFLAQPTSRSGAKGDCVPAWVAAAEDSRGIVAEPGPNGIELYPVRAGAVLEEESRVAMSQGLEEALASLRWTAPDTPRDDWPWLLAWLNTRRRSGRYLALGATSEASSARPPAPPPPAGELSSHDAVAFARRKRKVGVADVERDLPQLAIQGLVHLVEVEDVGDNSGKHAHRRDKSEQPCQQPAAERGHAITPASSIRHRCPGSSSRCRGHCG
jgi:hypothetical protein